MPEDYFDRLNLAKVLSRAYEEGAQPDTLQSPPINPANELSRRLMDSPVGEKAKTFAGAPMLPPAVAAQVKSQLGSEDQ